MGLTPRWKPQGTMPRGYLLGSKCYSRLFWGSYRFLPPNLSVWTLVPVHHSNPTSLHRLSPMGEALSYRDSIRWNLF